MKEEAELTIDGRRLQLAWYSRRKADAPVVVMLHQGLGSITQWRSFPAALAARTGYSVLAYDRHGHGRSAPTVEPRQPDFLDREATIILPAILERFGIAQPILYGHSDGGTIALMFAAAFPDRPKAIVSEAAHVLSEVKATGGFADLIADYRDGGLRAKLARHHGDQVDALFEGWTRVWRSPLMNEWSMVDRLHRVCAPLLLIQGEDDEHGSMRQIDAITQAVNGPCTTLLLPGCGHAPHLEQPERVVDSVATFLGARH